MKADAKTVQEILYSPEQFLIPFFQRHYSWKVPHWQRLWDDLRALATAAKPTRHFLGPLVCTPHNQMPGNVAEYLLIDGQQRLTTLTILLAAIRDIAKQHYMHELESQINEGYLIHKYQKGNYKYKVIPRIGDREVLFGVIDGDQSASSRRDGVARAYKFFSDAIRAFIGSDPETNLRRLFGAATAQMSLVVINIDNENPYEIFDSLNTAGLKLEEADLIRNFIFMQIPLGDQAAFNAKHWQPFEAMFEETDDYPELSPTPFYRDYLMRNGIYSRKGSTFIDFKEALRNQEWEPAVVVKELKSYAVYELLVRRPATASDEQFRKALRRIELLKVSTAHPLLFSLLARHEKGLLSTEDLLGCFRDLESFVLRRAIVGESAKAYSRWFPEVILAIKDSPRTDLQAYWVRRGWPDDNTFVESLVTFNLYRREPLKCRAVLEELEASFGHKEQVPFEKLSIEHVMPQTIEDDKNGRAWQVMLGEQWQKVHETWLDTIGNLTLTGYNPNLSNKAFERKQALLVESKVGLNKHFGPLSEWQEETIAARGRELATRVATIWSRPTDAPYQRDTDSNDNVTFDDGRVLEGDLSFREYWTGFVGQLGKHSQLNPISGPADKRRLAFDSNRDAARYIVECDPDEESVSVQLRFSGKSADWSLKILEEERTAIDAELNATTDWRHEKPYSVALYLDAVRTKDNDDWPRQFEWLSKTLIRFMEVIEPRIHTPKDGLDQKALIKEFWTKFSDYLVRQHSPVEFSDPSSSQWQTIDLRKNVWLWMQNSPNNWIGGGLVFEGKKATAIFERAKEDLSSLSKASGVAFEINDETTSFDASRFARLTDRTRWPEHFDWLKRVLESSKRFFEEATTKAPGTIASSSPAS